MSGFRKDDRGKARFGLVPPAAHRAVADVLTYGADKYEPNNWCRSADWSRYVDALERHLNAWKAGERDDPESGHPHLAHAGCCLLFLLEYEISGIGRDDRICHAIAEISRKDAVSEWQTFEETSAPISRDPGRGSSKEGSIDDYDVGKVDRYVDGIGPGPVTYALVAFLTRIQSAASKEQLADKISKFFELSLWERANVLYRLAPLVTETVINRARLYSEDADPRRRVK